jgi:hypothetical protein
MKKTLNIDDELFQEAKRDCGAATDTATVRLGLEALGAMRLLSVCGLLLAASLRRKTYRGGGNGRAPNVR